MADERLDEHGQAKVRGLLDAGDPNGEVRDAWHAYQVVREIYTINDADTGTAFVARLAADLRDRAGPPEVRRLGRTFTKWQSQIAAWHLSHVSNGPTEAVIIWSLDWGVVHVADDGYRVRWGRVIWSDVVMVTEGVARVG